MARVSRSGENILATTSRKVPRAHSPKLRFGGDEMVDRDGISTENHLEFWRRLVKAGPSMHGTPGPRRPRKS
jgi:hypothetical protein